MNEWINKKQTKQNEEYVASTIMFQQQDRNGLLQAGVHCK
jgi:hypothetical protein